MQDRVVLLHGIARTSASMIPLERALRASGYAVLNLDYRSRHLPFAALAGSIHTTVERFVAASPGAIHIVAHSMGGLVARDYLIRHRPARLGRVVMLGTPHRGSEVADRLHRLALYRLVFGPAGQQLTTAQCLTHHASLGAVDYPLGIIAGNRPLNAAVSALLLPGPNDGKVSVESTRIDGMADHLVVETSHTSLIRHRPAIAQTITFLRDGAFSRPMAWRRRVAEPASGASV